MPDLEGVLVAAVTPRGQQGDVDLGVAFELIDHICLGAAGFGPKGIALFTAAGEYPAFAPNERSRLVYLASKRSRVPILVGVGSATLEASLGLAREARQAGAAAVLLPPPYYYRYRQDDIGEFYGQFAAQLGGGIQVFLSNYPAFTNAIEPATAECLLETGRFAGIEDDSGDWDTFRAFQAAAARHSLPVLLGDALLMAARPAGARGVVSAVACAVPELVVALDRAIATEDRSRIDALTPIFQEFLSWTHRLPHPVIVKTAAALRGLKMGPLAIPVPLEGEKEIARFREWFQSWLPELKKMAVNA